MAKIAFSLHTVANDIKKAEKRLKAIRPKVVPGDQQKIDLELKVLDKAYVLLRELCPKGKHPIPFGQSFLKK